MNGLIESEYICDSDCETGLLKSLGISPKFINTSLTPKHFMKTSKLQHRLSLRKSSMQMTSQRVFDYDNPCKTTSRQKQGKRVSVGFYINNEFQGKVVNTVPKKTSMKNFKTTAELNNLRLQSSSNQSKEIAHATYSIQRLLKIREKLRKYSLITQQIMKFSTKNDSKQKLDSYSDKQLIHTYYENKPNIRHNNSQQKFQLLRSLKKGQIIRRKIHSRQECNQSFQIPSYRSTQSTGNNYSSTQSIKLNVQGIKILQRCETDIY